MEDLEKEAKKYSELPQHRNLFGVYTGFIAGANSVYVETKVIEAQINILEKMKNEPCNQKNNHVIAYALIKCRELKKKLNELKNEA